MRPALREPRAVQGLGAPLWLLSNTKFLLGYSSGESHLPKQPGTGKDRSMPTHGKCAPTTFQSRGGSTRHRVRRASSRFAHRSGPTPNVQGSGRAEIAARLTRVHSYPYPSFLSHSWESLVIQFLASASFGKSFTCISGLSGNVTTTIQLCPAFMGRASNLISAPALAMGRNMRPKL